MKLGDWGEAQVAQELERWGFRVLERNWRCRYGELDLVVAKPAYLVFVEVKTRKNNKFAHAFEAVDNHKQQKLRHSAELYLANNQEFLRPGMEIRFDVASVYAPQGVETKEPEISILENAF